MVVFRWLSLLVVLTSGSPLHAVASDDPRLKIIAKPDADSKVERIAGELAISALRGRSVRVEMPVSDDGSDDRPLVLAAALRAEGVNALATGPVWMTVRWPEAVVGVGLTSRKGTDRFGFARWNLAGVQGSSVGQEELDSEGFLNFARVLIMSRTIILQVSEDGTTWRRLGDLPRQGPLAGAPMGLVLGGGWGGENRLDWTADAEPADPKKTATTRVTYGFSQITAMPLVDDLPSSLLKTYQRGDSREDTFDRLLAASFIRSWWIAGSYPQSRDTLGTGPNRETFDPAKPFEVNGNARPWIEVKVGTELNERLVVASDVVKGGKSESRFIAAFIESDEAKTVRFWFDAKESMALYVNGRPVTTIRQDQRGSEAELDRCATVAYLEKGRNLVVLRLTSDANGRSAFIFRQEPGDPRYRIAMHKRLTIDFPDDEGTAEGLREAAHLWEEAGHLLAAIGVLNEIIERPEAEPALIEECLLERARLRTRLHDREGLEQDIAAVSKHWATAGGDPATVYARAAGLWERLGEPERALADLTKAITLPDLSAQRRVDFAQDRLRLLIATGRLPEIPASLYEISALLPKGSLERDRLIAWGLVAETEADGGSTARIDSLLTGQDPHALRVAVGLSRRIPDAKRALTGLLALSTLQGSGPFDHPRIALAEALAAAGDPGGALAAYQSYLSSVGITAPADLQGARTTWIRSRIAAYGDPAAFLLANPGKDVESAYANRPLRSWSVIGPFPNDAWKAYDKIPIDPTLADGKSPVGKLAWLTPATDAYTGEILNLKRAYDIDNHVAFCFHDVDIPVAGDGQLSMGADDGLIVWINGVKVYEDRTQRGVTPDSIQIPITLVKGRNRVLAMVQNGSGDWGIQGRIFVSGAIRPALTNAVARALVDPAAREESARLIASAAEDSLRFQVGEAAIALIDAGLSAFPDQAIHFVPLAKRYLDWGNAAAQPALAASVLKWLLARGEDTLPPSDDSIGTRYRAGEVFSNLGEIIPAREAFDAFLWTKFNLVSHGHALRSLGDVSKVAGDPGKATNFYAQVLAMDAADGDAKRRARESLATVRRLKPTPKPVTASLDATSALRLIERIALGDDASGLSKAFSQAITTGAGEVVPDGVDLYRGIAVRCGDVLRSVAPAQLETFSQRFNRAAEEDLARALATDDINALERTAITWPVTPSAATALVAAAQRYAALGADGLASSTVAMVTSRFTLSPDRLAGLSPLTRTVAARKAGVFPTALITQIPVPLSAQALFAVRRLVGEGGKTLHAVPVPTVSDGVAYLHTGVQAIAVQIQDGRELWRTDSSSVVGKNPNHTISGMPVAKCIVLGDVVVGRSVLGTGPRLEAFDRHTGRLRWTSEGIPELTGLDASSLPTTDGVRIIVEFRISERVLLVALRPSDGKLLWKTFMPMVLRNLDLYNVPDVVIADTLGAPAIMGRDCFVSLDSGGVANVDTGTGQVRWLATYPRGQFFQNSGPSVCRLLERVPGMIAIGRNLVLVIPRDHTGCFAVDRLEGIRRWNLDLLDARGLAGIARHDEDEIAIVHGDSVTALTLANGRVRWTWRPNDGATIGSALIDGDEVIVPTLGGLNRLAIADGSMRGSISWRALGLVGAQPANLIRSGDLLVAAGNAGLAILGVGKPPAKPAILLPQPAVQTSVTMVLPIPPAKGDLPLTPVWRIAAQDVQDIIRPGDAIGGDLYVRMGQDLVRLDAETGGQSWRLGLPKDIRRLGVGGKVVAMVTGTTVAAASRDTGSLRWILPLNTMPWTSGEPDQVRIAVGPTTVATWNSYGSSLALRDAWTGRLNADIQVKDTRIISVIEIADHLVVIGSTDRDKALLVQRRPLSDPGKIESSKKLELNTNDLGVWRVPGHPAAICGGHQSAWIDLTTGELRRLDLPVGWIFSLRMEGDLLGCMTRSGNTGHDHLINPATGTVIYSEKVADHWGEAWDYMRYRLARSGDRLIRCSQDKQQDIHLLAKDLKGNIVYDIKREKRWERSPILFVVLDGRAHVLFSAGGRINAELLDDAGATKATNCFALDPGPGMHQLLVVGSTLVLPERSGLVGLRAGDPTAANPIAADPKATIASKELLIRSQSKPTPRGVVPYLSKRILVDGHADDWGEVPSINLDGSSIRDLGRALGVPASASYRYGWNADGVHVLMHTDDPEYIEGLPGAVGGDGLRIGIHPYDKDRDEMAVIEVHRLDGQTRIIKRLGSWAADDPGAPAPEARIAIGASGWTAEVRIPWELLRHIEADRPGDRRGVRIALAVFDWQDDGPVAARETDFGLLGNPNVSLWPAFDFAAPPK